MCVLMLLYVSSYYCLCVLILVSVCSDTTLHVSSYYYLCPHTICVGIRVLCGQSVS